MRKRIRFKGILTKLIIGVAVFAKAATAAVAPARYDFEDDVWTNIRKEIGTDTRDPEVSEDLLEQILSRSVDLIEAAKLSYQLTPPEHWLSVDQFWISQFELRTDPELFFRFLAVRQNATNATDLSQSKILENWLHKTHHRPNHYDNGGGND